MSVFLKPLLLTIVIELFLAYLFGLRRKELLLTVFVNMITNPLLVLLSILIYRQLGLQEFYLLTYLLLEPVVILAECWIYRYYLGRDRHPFVLSVLLNTGSILGGLLWNFIF